MQDPATGVLLPRTLLGDTGAGDATVFVEIIVSEADGRRFGGRDLGQAKAGGAIIGQFPIVAVAIEMSALKVSRQAAALIVPASQLPEGLDGIAAFRLLNTFSYGNFGDATRFGLETI